MFGSKKAQRGSAFLFLLGLSSALGAGACEEHSSVTDTQGSTGSVGLSLQVGSSINFSSVQYEITGNGFHKSGSIDASGALIKANIGGIPAGSSYSIVLRAVDADDANTTCEGSASFSIQANRTSPVSVVLRCRLPHKTGSVLVDGKVNVCPTIEELSVASTSVRPGQALALTAAGSDDDAAPSALKFAWSVNGGTLSNASAASSQWTCTQAGNFLIQLEVTDGDCSDTLSANVECANAVLKVHATAETAPVTHSGDAADDPAIWVHPTEPSRSLIIGTDKTAEGGLNVYALDGSLVQSVTAGQLNNVDLRTGFALAGSPTTLVTAGNRTNNTIAIFSLDAATRSLTDVAEAPIVTLATYGSCMYRSATSGKVYYFVNSKAGAIEQWELFESPTAPGKVTATKVRTLKQLSSQPEACAADDATGKLYVGEEDVGIWKFDAEPSVTSGAGWEGEMIASVASGLLVADVEGVAIVSTGDSTGFILASNQGDSTYAVFDRKPPHAWIKTFSVQRGASCIDAVTGSDGIEATPQNLGPAFPHGAFVTQDDTNDGGNQNFKLVPLEWILDVAPAVDASQCGGQASDAGVPEADAGRPDAALGWGAQYCLDFCQKCQACYATGTFSEGDCHYQTSKPNFDLNDCAAGCAVSATPGAAAHGTLTDGWQSLSCEAFDGAM